jgi:hypothetical protein
METRLVEMEHVLAEPKQKLAITLVAVLIMAAVQPPGMFAHLATSVMTRGFVVQMVIVIQPPRKPTVPLVMTAMPAQVLIPALSEALIALVVVQIFVVAW